MKKLKALILILSAAVLLTALFACKPGGGTGGTSSGSSNGGSSGPSDGGTYTIQYVYNDVVLHEEQVNGNEESLTLPSISLDGFTFFGWFYDEACTKPFDGRLSKNPLSGDITVYASIKPTDSDLIDPSECTEHVWWDSACAKCGTPCTHRWENFVCAYCGLACPHYGADEDHCEDCGLSGLMRIYPFTVSIEIYDPYNPERYEVELDRPTLLDAVIADYLPHPYYYYLRYDIYEISFMGEIITGPDRVIASNCEITLLPKYGAIEFRLVLIDGNGNTEDYNVLAPEGFTLNDLSFYVLEGKGDFSYLLKTATVEFECSEVTDGSIQITPNSTVVIRMNEKEPVPPYSPDKVVVKYLHNGVFSILEFPQGVSFSEVLEKIKKIDKSATTFSHVDFDNKYFEATEGFNIYNNVEITLKENVLYITTVKKEEQPSTPGTGSGTSSTPEYNLPVFISFEGNVYDIDNKMPFFDFLVHHVGIGEEEYHSYTWQIKNDDNGKVYLPDDHFIMGDNGRNFTIVRLSGEASNCDHEWINGHCDKCGNDCAHEWDNGYCHKCDYTCPHDFVSDKNTCDICSGWIVVNVTFGDQVFNVYGHMTALEFLNQFIPGFNETSVIEDYYIVPAGGIAYDAKPDKRLFDYGTDLELKLKHKHNWVDGFCHGCNNSCPHHRVEGNICDECGMFIPNEEDLFVKIKAYLLIPYYSETSEDGVPSGYDAKEIFLDYYNDGSITPTLKTLFYEYYDYVWSEGENSVSVDDVLDRNKIYLGAHKDLAINPFSVTLSIEGGKSKTYSFTKPVLTDTLIEQFFKEVGENANNYDITNETAIRMEIVLTQNKTITFAEKNTVISARVIRSDDPFVPDFQSYSFASPTPPTLKEFAEHLKINYNDFYFYSGYDYSYALPETATSFSQITAIEKSLIEKEYTATIEYRDPHNDEPTTYTIKANGVITLGDLLRLPAEGKDGVIEFLNFDPWNYQFTVNAQTLSPVTTDPLCFPIFKTTIIEVENLYRYRIEGPFESINGMREVVTTYTMQGYEIEKWVDEDLSNYSVSIGWNSELLTYEQFKFMSLPTEGNECNLRFYPNMVKVSLFDGFDGYENFVEAYTDFPTIALSNIMYSYDDYIWTLKSPDGTITEPDKDTVLSYLPNFAVMGTEGFYTEYVLVRTMRYYIVNLTVDSVAYGSKMFDKKLNLTFGEILKEFGNFNYNDYYWHFSQFSSIEENTVINRDVDVVGHKKEDATAQSIALGGTASKASFFGRVYLSARFKSEMANALLPAASPLCKGEFIALN